MVRTVNVRVAIHTASVESEDVETGCRLMTWQQVDVTLLAQLMCPARQQLLIVRAVGSMASQTILLDRRVLPEQWPALFSMTCVTDLIGRMRHQHSLAFAAMRFMAGGTGNLESDRLIVSSRQTAVGPGFRAEKMCRALEKCFAYFAMAA